jgi:hypothetical protein
MRQAIIPEYRLAGEYECACPTCRRVFASEEAFDLHRVGDHGKNRKCAENLDAQGLTTDSKGRWRRAR